MLTAPAEREHHRRSARRTTLPPIRPGLGETRRTHRAFAGYMEILKPHSLTQFVEIAAPFLCRAEAAHGLLLGTAIASVSSKPDAYSAIVMSRGAVVAAGLRTTTRLIVSHESEAGAMTLLSSDATGPELEGVIGPPDSVETFTAASGGEWRRVMGQAVYECRRVVHEQKAPGAMRAALPMDRNVITDWVQRLAGVSGSGLRRVAGRRAHSVTARRWAPVCVSPHRPVESDVERTLCSARLSARGQRRRAETTLIRLS
jgi:hypothetical protein